MFKTIGSFLVGAKNAVSWWWKSIGIRGPWLLLFVGIVTFSATGLVRYQILVTDYLDVETPLGIYTLGGRAIVLSVFLLLAPLAIFRPRVTFWLGLALLLWWNVFDSFLVPGGRDRWKTTVADLLGTLDGIQTIAGFIILVGLIIALILVVIELVASYAQSLDEWVKNRSLELFGEGATGAHQTDTSNRSVSLLAVFALIFSLFLPILGLILAYAARHDIAVSNGRKSGKDMSIAASIISWFSLIVLLLILLVIFIGAVLDVALLAFLFN